MAKKSDITIEKVLTDLQDAFHMAKMAAKPNDMINASMSQAKLVGLLRDRIETGAVGEFDDMNDLSEVIEKVRLEAGDDAASALATAFGYAPEKKEEPALIEQAPPSDLVN